MAPLSTAARNRLPASKFLDPEHRKYPVEDKKHAQLAVAFAHGARGAPKRPDVAKKAQAVLSSKYGKGK